MKNIFVLDNKKLLKISAVVIFMITVIALKGIAQDNEVELTIEIIE
jgi:hypothetical protein